MDLLRISVGLHVSPSRKSHATDRYATALETRIILTGGTVDFLKNRKAVGKDVKKETEPFGRRVRLARLQEYNYARRAGTGRRVSRSTTVRTTPKSNETPRTTRIANQKRICAWAVIYPSPMTRSI